MTAHLSDSDRQALRLAHDLREELARNLPDQGAAPSISPYVDPAGRPSVLVRLDDETARALIAVLGDRRVPLAPEPRRTDGSLPAPPPAPGPQQPYGGPEPRYGGPEQPSASPFAAQPGGQFAAQPAAAMPSGSPFGDAPAMPSPFQEAPAMPYHDGPAVPDPFAPSPSVNTGGYPAVNTGGYPAPAVNTGGYPTPAVNTGGYPTFH
ncbi:hypothetical protein [Actinomadura rupiterrae]|uniref:hypothetical protein n=1 Tax=Actinomadura rupiterrae TaxID=559627 RepID=UPI0020A55A9D|nr:hypothetical protein [Actinomadura rupiterrae]MCP2340955.1 hypothetical protein [Actinomadura rupiterrae]